jgi:hypothetical protein
MTDLAQAAATIAAVGRSVGLRLAGVAGAIHVFGWHILIKISASACNSCASSYILHSRWMGLQHFQSHGITHPGAQGQRDDEQKPEPITHAQDDTAHALKFPH